MHAFNRVSLLPWLLSLCMLIAAHCVAGEEAEPELSSAQQQAQAAWQAASEAMIHGPRTIELRDQAQLELPYGYGFVPQQQAAALMRTMGNLTGEDFIGLVFPEGDSAPWFVSIQFEGSGYVKDDDAKHWNADELLQSLKDGTEAGNEERAQMGIPALKVTRWVEEPKYEARDHRLVWSAEAMLKDIEDPDPTINYNTYALGRDGYISLNLVTTVVDGRCRQTLGAGTAGSGRPQRRKALYATSTRPPTKSRPTASPRWLPVWPRRSSVCSR